MNSFHKMQGGTWGLRIDGPIPKAGDVVQVTKCNGDTKRCTIGEVLWHGIAKNGVESSLCSIAGAYRKGPPRFTRNPRYDALDEQAEREEGPLERNLGDSDAMEAACFVDWS